VSIAPVRDSLTVQFKEQRGDFEIQRSTTYAQFEQMCLARFGIRPRPGATVRRPRTHKAQGTDADASLSRQVDIVVIDVEDNEEIGWLSRSTFRPLATHHRMTLEGLDGFAYELRVTGAFDRVKRSEAVDDDDDDDHVDHDDDDDGSVGLATLDLSALKGKLPAVAERDDDDNNNNNDDDDDDDDTDDDTDDADDTDAVSKQKHNGDDDDEDYDFDDDTASAPARSAQLKRKKAFQSLPQKGSSSTPTRPLNKSLSNVASLGASKSGNKASLFDVFAELDDSPQPDIPLIKSGSLMNLSQSSGGAIRKKKPSHDVPAAPITARGVSESAASAAAAATAAAAAADKKKKKKKSKSKSDAAAEASASRSSRPTESAPLSPSGRGRLASPRRSGAERSERSERSPSRTSAAARSPRGLSPRSRSPRPRSPRPRSPRSRSPRGGATPRGLSPRPHSPRHRSERRSPRIDDDLSTTEEDSDGARPAASSAAASAVFASTSDALPMVGGAPIGGGTLIDITKLRAGKVHKAPDSKGDVGQAARTHLVTQRADGTKSLSAIPGSISPLEKDRADEQLYGSLLKGQPKHRAKAKKSFFHRAGRSSKRQVRFSRQLIAAHPEASFEALDGASSGAAGGGSEGVEVSAAPFIVLVELLSHPREHDDTFEEHFLLTFPSFATPVELLEALIKRFVAHTPIETPNNALVRERILQFVMRWMNARDDFASDEALGVVLVDFLSASLEQQSKASETKLLTEVFNLFKAKIAASVEGSAPSTAPAIKSGTAAAAAAPAPAATKKKETTKAAAAAAPAADAKKAKKSGAAFKEPAPIPFLPINMSYRSTGLSFFDLHPVEIARQMTLLEHAAFLATPTDEWCSANWQSSIGRVIMRFNDLSRWVTSEVVTADTVEYRALLVRRFVVIASTCLSLNNFNGVMEVLSGLQAPSVQRLKQTWKALNGEASKTYKALADLMSLDAKNVAKFRERMEQAAAPCVPYIGFYVGELSSLEESQPTYFEDGRINVAKQAAKIPVLTTIRMLQSEGREERFNLVPIGFIQDFLLQQAVSTTNVLAGSHLLNDDELMTNSRKREPDAADAASPSAAASSSDGKSKSKRK
jgi:hypothetical protein